MAAQGHGLSEGEVTPLTMSMYLPMPSYTVSMDDSASRLVASRTFSSTTNVASYTKLSSPIYKKKREKRRETREEKRGHNKSSQPRHKTLLPNY